MNEREHFRAQLRNGGTLEPFGETRNGPPPKPSTNGRPPCPPKRDKGRFQVLNQFVDESARLVSTTAQTAWYVLYRETKSNGTAEVSHNQIAERIGVSRRTAMRSVGELADAGLVEVVRRGTAEGNTPSTYKVFGRPQSK